MFLVTLFCSLFLSHANAATGETFKVDAKYTRPGFYDAGFDVKLSSIADRISYTVEVKTELQQVVTNILSIEDGITSYHEDMQPDFTIGDCHGIQTAVGQYEAFKLNEAPAGQAVIVREPVQDPNMPKPPGTPGAAPGFPQGRPYYKIATALTGVEHLRGWNFSFDNAACTLPNIPERDGAQVQTSLEFNSKDLKTAGSSIVVDKTENGFGWVFTITRLPLN